MFLQQLLRLFAHLTVEPAEKSDEIGTAARLVRGEPKSGSDEGF